MECYRSNCKSKCDKYKMMGCIFRMTEEQRNLVSRIKGQSYCECGEMLIKAKYGDREIDLCTSCGVRGKVKGMCKGNLSKVWRPSQILHKHTHLEYSIFGREVERMI